MKQYNPNSLIEKSGLPDIYNRNSFIPEVLA
jgi:hypothetical protein